jgi:hypothetical protein
MVCVFNVKYALCRLRLEWHLYFYDKNVSIISIETAEHRLFNIVSYFIFGNFHPMNIHIFEDTCCWVRLSNKVKNEFTVNSKH